MIIRLCEKLLEAWLLIAYISQNGFMVCLFFAMSILYSAQGTVESTFHRHNLGWTLLLAANWFVGDVPLSTWRRSHEGHMGTHFCRTKLTLLAINVLGNWPWHYHMIPKNMIFFIWFSYLNYYCLVLLGDNEPATPRGISSTTEINIG